MILKEKINKNITYIPIKDKLELSDYYRTDSHWTQYKIEDVANTILEGMRNKAESKYETKEIEGFYVLQVTLKRKYYDSKNILLLQKLIPQKMVFAMQHEEQTQFCIFHTRLQQSEWMPTAEAAIPLQGLSLDDVWNNIVATIGGLDAQAEQSIEEQIIHREQREKLLRQLESLEKQCRTEKQTRKKYELHQQIIKLKEELK